MPFDIDNDKKKRYRRTATEIARHYKCPITDCPKSYGGEGSLNQHIKLKHPEHYAEMLQHNNAQQSIEELGKIKGMDGFGVNDKGSLNDSSNDDISEDQ